MKPIIIESDKDGETIFIGPQEHRGVSRFHIRRMYQRKDGGMGFGKGISFDPDILPDILAAICTVIDGSLDEYAALSTGGDNEEDS